MTKYTTILITGASSGIGKAVAEGYAAPGVTLLLLGRDDARLAAVADSCRKKGAAVDTSTIPVTDSARLERQILSWDDQSPIDLVIANAGISGGSGTDARSDEKFRAIIATNIDGTFNTVNPLIPRMKSRRAGRIALVSSMAGFRGMPNAPAYSTSKVAVRAYGDALRPLLKESGVGVSIIFPGFVKTPLTDVNTFPMPFLMEAEKAGSIIRRGLDAGKAFIAFPWQMHVLAWFIGALPRCIGDTILARAPKKS